MIKNSSSVMRIGLMGPFGFGNLGDAAIQQAVLQHIHKYYPDAEILGFSLNPDDTQKRHGIPSFPVGRMASNGWLKPIDNPKYLVRLNELTNRLCTSRNRSIRLFGGRVFYVVREILSIWDASKTLRALDYFIVSGGGQLDDYWGGPWHHPYTMLIWSFLARLRKAKLCFVSVGAGPIDHRLSRWFIKAALSLANYRSYRDQKSKDLIASIGFRNAQDGVYPDLAHSLDIEPYLTSPPLFSRSIRPLVGIGPMAYFDPRVWPERDQLVYMDYLSKLAVFIVWLLQNDQDVLLFTGEAFHDREVIADLRELLAVHGISKTDGRVIEPPIETVDDLMCQLATTDLVVASRFHGVLLAQLLNKPVLALSYHPKIDNLMADIGQADYCLPIDSFDLDTVKERFARMEANCQAIKATMAARTQEYREALDEQYRRIFNCDSDQTSECRDVPADHGTVPHLP